MFARLISITSAAALVATVAIAGGHGSPEDQAVGARKAQMSLISFNMGPLGAMAKGEMDFDAEMAAQLGADLKALADLEMSRMWLEGTDNGAHPTTRAAPAIWQDYAGFEEDMADLSKAGDAIAASTDLAGLQAAVGMAGAACGACHKAYRGPKR